MQHELTDHVWKIRLKQDHEKYCGCLSLFCQLKFLTKIKIENEQKNYVFDSN